ncbi:arsenate reductase (thioredoxin) [Liquorilactobacillus vini]|nr:arsenate reductase (thioredoxin) [Liquorilactobacillus vini]
MQIYFLCTGNSCRSQMAEGFAKKFFPQEVKIASAGLTAKGLNPLAVQVMAEKGIDISHNQSKQIDPNFLNSSDLVVTLCGDARDNCPLTPPTVKRIHWPLLDPAQAQGSKQEKLQVFREVSDEIEKQVKVLADNLKTVN